MRVLISADMESATGVSFPDDVEPDSRRWDYNRLLFAGDVNAAIGAFFDAGAAEVLVNEAHSRRSPGCESGWSRPSSSVEKTYG
jgi:D-amino peptidase